MGSKQGVHLCIVVLMVVGALVWLLGLSGTASAEVRILSASETTSIVGGWGDCIKWHPASGCETCSNNCCWNPARCEYQTCRNQHGWWTCKACCYPSYCQNLLNYLCGRLLQANYGCTHTTLDLGFCQRHACDGAVWW